MLRLLAGDAREPALRVFFLESRMPSPRPWLALAPGDTVLLLLRAVVGGFAPEPATGKAIETFAEVPRPPVLSKVAGVARELEQIVLAADPASQRDVLVRAATARAELRGDLDVGAPGAIGDPSRRLAWIAIALADGKRAALDDLATLASGDEAPDDEVLLALAARGVEAVSRPADVARLERLLRAPQPALARAAASALRAIGEPAGMVLARALDHALQDVRYHAVVALAELGAFDGAPSLDVYRTHESPYRERARRWALERGWGAPP